MPNHIGLALAGHARRASGMDASKYDNPLTEMADLIIAECRARHSIDRVKAHRRKLKAIMAGGTAIIGDDFFDEIGDELPNNFASIPNTRRLGMKDKYIGALSNHTVIKQYNRRNHDH